MDGQTTFAIRLVSKQTSNKCEHYRLAKYWFAIVFANVVINNVHCTYFDFRSRQSQSHTYDLSSKTSQIFKKLYGFVNQVN